MYLQELFRGIPHIVVQGAEKIKQIQIRGLSCDSKKMHKNTLFVCITGVKEDGHCYIKEACEKGASCILIEKYHMRNIPENVVVIRVKDTRAVYAHLCARWFHFPANDLKIIGITGTKGKTTTAYLIYHMLQKAGVSVGLIGTIETIIEENVYESKNTTPDAFTIHQYFDTMKGKGLQYVVMEVSSQALKQKRVEGISFDVAVFTNLHRDHIGKTEHASLEEYRYYKSLLFKRCKVAVGNVDDLHCSYMFRRTICKKLGYSCQGHVGNGILTAKDIVFVKNKKGLGTSFLMGNTCVKLGLPGMFNVYNALAAIQAVRALGISVEEVIDVLADVKIPGRMEKISVIGTAGCYVDYAHNAYSMKEMLQMFRSYKPERIIIVFGCGGNRDIMRRIEMGKVAGKLADLCIITTDNPRTESPKKIVEDIVKGIEKSNGKYQIIDDRKEAIAYALRQAKAQDIVVVAGKGHEDYQEMNGVRYHLDDKELIREIQMEEGNCTQILS